MRVFLLCALVVLLSQSAQAFDDMEMRDRWSQQVMALKKGACDSEDEEAVKKKLLYAASLIMHGEYIEARASIKTAEDSAKGGKCKEAVPKAMKPQ